MIEHNFGCAGTVESRSLNDALLFTITSRRAIDARELLACVEYSAHPRQSYRKLRARKAAKFCPYDGP